MAVRIYRALGLMSGTSLDGVDAALVETDGEEFISCGAALMVPFAEPVRDRLRALFGVRPETALAAVVEAEREITQVHAEAVGRLLHDSAKQAGEIDVIGFHGVTILHRPKDKVTVQLGDGALLAELTGIDVVSDFRSRDLAEGGEGAPLVPLFHAALAANLVKPLAVLNIGGSPT
jgi:Predicted molecular chaperone distantly related to HSP70-fold metalloproteases